jgi:hypothetical protein
MNLQAILSRRAEIAARLVAIAAIPDTEVRTLSTEEVTESETLDAEDVSLAATQAVLEKAAARAARDAVPATQRAAGSLTANGGRLITGAPSVLTKTTREMRAGDKFKGESWAKLNLARITAALGNLSGEQINVSSLLATLYPGRPDLAAVAQHKSRFRAAGVEGGATVSGEAGAELLATDATFTGDFIEFLYSQVVFDSLGLRDISADVTIKGQDGAFTGYWVGEKKPIPASIGSFSDVTLRPLKAAGLTYLSKDLIRRSAPEALMLFRDGIVEAIAQAVDTKFFSADAASANVSPAGILNGLAGVASVGGRVQDVYTDLAYLTGIFVTAKQRGELKLVSNKIVANQIAHLLSPLTAEPAFKQVTKDGGTINGTQYLTGENVIAANLLLIKPSDIYKVKDSGVEVSLSTDATIEADTVPTGEGSGPTAQSASMVSMFQTEMVAIKAVRDITWAMRRSSAIVVARKTAVDYDGTEDTTD